MRYRWSLCYNVVPFRWFKFVKVSRNRIKSLIKFSSEIFIWLWSDRSQIIFHVRSQTACDRPHVAFESRYWTYTSWYVSFYCKLDRFLRKTHVGYNALVFNFKSGSIFVQVVFVTSFQRQICAIDRFWKSNSFPSGDIFKSLAAKNKLWNDPERSSFIFKVSISFNNIVLIVTNVMASYNSYLLHLALILSIFHPFYINRTS